MQLSDLHIHTNFSDGKLSIPEVVDFYGSRGFKIIAITDHLCEENTLIGKTTKFLNKTLTKKTFPEYLKIIATEGKRALKQYGMLVIPGVEITKNSVLFKRSAHILALGINNFIPPDGSVHDTIHRIHYQGGLAIAAHPVSTQIIEHQTYHLWNNRDEFSKKFDAWEVASGPHIFQEVLNSGLPMIANSDFHNPKQN